MFANVTRTVLILLLAAVSHVHAGGLPDISYKSHRVLVCSHRANYGDAPENSLAAINACIQGGVDIIEIDVRKTKDGKLVLLHDRTVDRTTDGKGKVEALTWAEVSKLRLYRGDGKNKVRTEERVPTLEDVLNLCNEKIYVNLDLKSGVHLVKDCATVIQKTRTESIIMYRATNLDWLKYVAEQFPRMYLSPIFDQRKMSVKDPGKDLIFLEPWMNGLQVWGLDIKDGDSPVLSKRNASSLEALNIRVWAYTLWGDYNDRAALENPTAVWGKLIDRGVNVIMTDEPDALIKYLKSIHRQ